MTLKARIKQLEEEQAERDARSRVCSCQLVIVTIGEEPTTEQRAQLERNAACRAHTAEERSVTVYEAPPMPEWMKTGAERPPRVIED